MKMCITAAPAKLSKTVVAAWQGQRKGKIFHGLGYQNQAENLSKGGNAMAFAIPAKPGTLTAAGFIDTRNTPRILDDMARAIAPVTRSMSVTRSFEPKGVSFFNVGMYSVFLSEDPMQIPAEIFRRLVDGSLPAEKAPTFRPELLKFYAEQYPGWPVAIFCFGNRQPQKSQPVMIVYEPKHPDFLYAPAVDCHTGGVPDLSAKVDVDHTVIFGVQSGGWGINPVSYSDQINEEISQYLPTHVTGQTFSGTMPNGDFVAYVEQVRRGLLTIRRMEPDFWNWVDRDPRFQK